MQMEKITIQMERVTIVSPLTKSEQHELYDLQTILCNLCPDMHIFDILWLDHDSVPKEARRLLKRLKHLMKKQNKVTRENI